MGHSDIYVQSEICTTWTTN